MKEFFKVTDLDAVFAYLNHFSAVAAEIINIEDSLGRILAEDLTSDINLPDFARTTRDGYAVRAASTFGASEGSPAYLTIKGQVGMGEVPSFSINSGEAARISTGGMLPEGADSVVMIEHTEMIDATVIEAYRSVAPGQYVITVGEDIQQAATVLTAGQQIRPQETGLLAALGCETFKVYRKPRVGIISTGDEIIPIQTAPKLGQIRDINTHTLFNQVRQAGGMPRSFGIVSDDYDTLFERCSQALQQSDLILISGGSSVGTRDFTIEVLSNLPDAHILVHGISISPGKPTILAEVGGKQFWGLPGHVVSAMVVFAMVVKPFLYKISGRTDLAIETIGIKAQLARNISSAQGRVDYIRVKLVNQKGSVWAEPVLGKSGLINTVVKADGLVAIDQHTEGLDSGAEVTVIPFD